MNEIQQDLAAGKEVIAHTDRIVAPGFTGEGYIIFDPVSGSGAYKITGGSNGGFAVAFWITAIAFAIGAALLIEGAIFFGIFVIVWEFINLALWIHAIKTAQTDADFNKANAGHALVALLGVIPFLELGGALAAIVQWFGILFALLIVETF